MPFNITPNVEIERDAANVVRQLRHIHEPFVAPPDLRPRTPEALARHYLIETASLFAIEPKWLTNLDKPVEQAFTRDEGTMLRLAAKKSLMETTVISFVQTHRGLPIWEAGVSVTLLEPGPRVTAAQSTLHFDVEVAAPREAKYMPERINPTTLARLLGLSRAPREVKDIEFRRPRINSSRLLIYRFDPLLRFDPESEQGGQQGPGLHGGPPTLRLAPVPRAIRPGNHYVVAEALFTLGLPQWGDLHWRAFAEVETGAVLYLRAFTACATGDIYTTDPITASGGTPPTSPQAQLDALRTAVTLPGLTPPPPGGNQSLSGNYVQLSDFSAPTAPPPTEATGNFLYSVPTDSFSAVNAYFHPDSLFRLMEGMGFTIPSYFDGTASNPGFPVPVDHRGFLDSVNARANGNSTGDGLGSFEFGRAAAGTTVGIAGDAKVVAHEFCHALLWDSVHSPNFGFAHSAGDSLAAIINDPGSLAPDRFLTFPWPLIPPANTPLDRRHDRPVVGGWAWGGANDVGGYSSEQIHSTTLFRLYRMTGGDCGHPNPAVRLATQRFAGRWAVYLIIRAIGSLATSPITPTPTPNVFATALMNADSGTTIFDGIAGGQSRRSSDGRSRSRASTSHRERRLR